MDQAKLIKLYDKQARQYEKLRKQKKSYDHAWRRELLGSAKGKVLEVSVGAGANFKFYPAGVEVTAVDISQAMIDKAKAAARDAGIATTFITSSVEDLVLELQAYDTVVSTLSLCAYPDPVKVLNLFNRWCKPDGKILLLEHGAGRYGFVRWVQRIIDPFQFRRIGCHADRPILEIVGQSDLRVRKCERKLMGIMYLIWAQPNSTLPESYSF